MRSKKTDLRKPSTLQFNRGLPATSPIRWKLLLLVGLLVFILVMMRYASDPKNWAWMGFDQRPNAAPNTAEPQSPRSAQAVLRLVPDRDSPSNEDEDIAARDASPKLDELKPALGELRQDFWTRLVRRFDSPSRLMLFALVRESPSTSEKVPLKSRENIVERIQQFRDQYATELLNQSGALENSDPSRKQLWYDLLFEWQKEWNQHVAPTLSHWAGQSSDGNASPDDLAYLREVLAQVAAGLVQDDAPLGRPIEVPYWNLLVDEVRSNRGDRIPASKVAWLELYTQPKSYRGKPVEIEGRIRGARLQQSSNPNGIVPQYYELWVQADEKSTIPFCVYALTMPAEFPQLTERLTTMDVPTKIVGYFFKNRSYLTESQQTQFCPVLLALDPQVTMPTAGAPATRPPSPFTFGGIFAGIALLAAWVTFRVYRATLFRRRVASPLVPATLRQLQSDSQVQSVSDRLARWEGSTNTGSESDPKIQPSD